MKVLLGEGRTVQSYQYLLGTRHKDDEDGLTYKVKRVAVSREGWIVGYRSLVTASGVINRKEKVSVHIADIHRMTTDLRPGAASGPQPDGDEGPTKSVHVSAARLDNQSRETITLMEETRRWGLTARGRPVSLTPPAGAQPEPIHNRHLKVEGL